MYVCMHVCIYIYIYTYMFCTSMAYTPSKDASGKGSFMKSPYILGTR